MFNRPYEVNANFIKDSKTWNDPKKKMKPFTGSDMKRTPDEQLRINYSINKRFMFA